MSCLRRTRAGCAQPAWTTAGCQRRPRPHMPRPSEGRRVTETRAFPGTVEAALVASAAERASRAEAPGAAGIVGAVGTAGVAATRAGTAIRRGAASCLRGDRGTWCTLRVISMPALGRLVAPVGPVSSAMGVAERIGATRATAVGVAAASGRRRSGTCTRRPRAAEMCSPRTRRCAGCRRICAATTAAGSGGRPSRRRARTGRAPLEHRPTTAKTTAASGTMPLMTTATIATTATNATAAEIGT